MEDLNLIFQEVNEIDHEGNDQVNNELLIGENPTLPNNKRNRKKKPFTKRQIIDKLVNPNDGVIHIEDFEQQRPENNLIGETFDAIYDKNDSIHENIHDFNAFYEATSQKSPILTEDAPECCDGINENHIIEGKIIMCI